MQIIKRLKLLVAKEELIDYFTECNQQYDKILDCCKQKEWKVFPNVHKTLTIIETQMDKEKEENKSPKKNKWYSDRAVDIGLKIHIMTNH